MTDSKKEKVSHRTLIIEESPNGLVFHDLVVSGEGKILEEREAFWRASDRVPLRLPTYDEVVLT